MLGRLLLGSFVLLIGIYFEADLRFASAIVMDLDIALLLLSLYVAVYMRGSEHAGLGHHQARDLFDVSSHGVYVLHGQDLRLLV